ARYSQRPATCPPRARRLSGQSPDDGWEGCRGDARDGASPFHELAAVLGVLPAYRLHLLLGGDVDGYDADVPRLGAGCRAVHALTELEALDGLGSMQFHDERHVLGSVFLDVPEHVLPVWIKHVEAAVADLRHVPRGTHRTGEPFELDDG